MLHGDPQQADQRTPSPSGRREESVGVVSRHDVAAEEADEWTRAEATYQEGEHL